MALRSAAQRGLVADRQRDRDGAGRFRQLAANALRDRRARRIDPVGDRNGDAAEMRVLGLLEDLQTAIAEPGRTQIVEERLAAEVESARLGRPGGRAQRGDAADLLSDAQLRLRDHGLDSNARRRRLPRQVLDIDLSQRDALTRGLQLDLVDHADEQGALDRRRQHAPVELRGADLAGQEAGSHGGEQNTDRERHVAPTQQPAGRDNRRERDHAHPDRRLDRQGEIAGDAGAERHRQPDRPKTALLGKQGISPLAQVGLPPATRDSCIRPQRDCQLPRTRPMAKNPAAPAHSGAKHHWIAIT
jgi:hypothetical protein